MIIKILTKWLALEYMINTINNNLNLITINTKFIGR